MTTQMEKSLWTRQKQSVVQSFIDERRKLVSSVAGRGFLLAPGFLYEFETGLELDAKQKLSEVSYKILSDAVERDIKQAGLDYNLEYKTAAIAWEIDKQILMSDWDRELSLIKQGWLFQEEEMTRLAIEVSRRRIDLLNAKTVIELQTEALRAQLAGVENGASDYEVQLAQQKLATATKKLQVIPILQQILEVEQDIIDKEQEIVAKEMILVGKETVKIGYLSDLVDVEEQIAEKKEDELLPVMQDLVTVSGELAAATREQLIVEIKIMAQKVIDAGIMVKKAEKQTQIAESQIVSETAQLSLIDAKIVLAEAQRQYELALRNIELGNVIAITNAEASSHSLVMNQERSTQSNVTNLKLESVTEKLAQDVTSSANLTTNAIKDTTKIADLRSDEAVRVAEFRAVSILTANLKHLIG